MIRVNGSRGVTSGVLAGVDCKRSGRGKLGRNESRSNAGEGLVNARQRLRISLQQHFGVAGSPPCARAGRAARRLSGSEIDRTGVTSFK
jgi:hypothetical protein